MLAFFDTSIHIDGTLLVTSDPHFPALRRHMPFAVKVLPAGK
jgi:hypothetical protein